MAPFMEVHMKLPSIALLALTFSSTTVFAKDIEWLGYFCIVNKLNQSCLDDGIRPGECATLRYTPRNMGSNGPSTRLSLYEQHWAANYTLPIGNLIGSRFKKVNGTGIAKGVWTFTSKMRIAKQIPRSSLTTYLALEGDIYDYDGATGCNIKFTAAVTRRP
jgi:hypothetical protein